MDQATHNKIVSFIWSIADLRVAAADLKQILKAVSWRVETAPLVIAKIRADILAMEKEAEGLLDGLLKVGASS